MSLASTTSMSSRGMLPWGKGVKLAMVVMLWMPDNRTRDLDNVLKSLKDGMNKVVYHDDKQIKSVHVVSSVVSQDQDPRADLLIWDCTPRIERMVRELWTHIQGLF